MESHILVLLHGLWGNPNHLKNLKKSIESSHPEIIVLILSSYQKDFTYDGVELCGERALIEIYKSLEVLKNNKITIKKFSIAGYSFGGLISRYVIGSLYKAGFFDDIIPMNFTTFATPHLGSLQLDTGIRGWFKGTLGPLLLGPTGKDLFLKTDVLSKLGDPNGIYIEALKMFKRKSLYANVVNDWTVPFYTGFITDNIPYSDASSKKLVVKYLKGYSPSIIDKDSPVYFQSDDKAEKNSEFAADNIKMFLFMAFAGSFFLPALVLFYFPFKSFAANKRVNNQDFNIGNKKLLDYIENEVNTSLKIKAAAKKNGQKTTKVIKEEGEDNEENKKKDFILHGYNFSNDSSTEIAGNLVHDLFDGTDNVDTSLNAGNIEADDSSNDVFTEDSGNLTDNRNSKGSDLLYSTKNSLKKSYQKVIPKSISLSNAQRKILNSLNNVGFEKYPVFIHNARHSHAAIVLRYNRKSFTDGEVVLKHYNDKLLL